MRIAQLKPYPEWDVSYLWDYTGPHYTSIMDEPNPQQKERTNMFTKLAFKIGKGYLLKQLNKDSFRSQIIDTVNAKVDIPKLTEKQEQQLFSSLYDAITAYIMAK